MFGCQKDSLTVTETPQDSRIDFRAAEKLLVCHNTGSETNPYELIEVAEIAYMKAHQEHGEAQPGEAIPGLDGYSLTIIKNSRFIRNQANYGAVIFTRYSDCVDAPEMTNCQFSHNIAYTRGAVHFDQHSLGNSCSTKITASVYSENKSSLGIPKKESQKSDRKKASYRSEN